MAARKNLVWDDRTREKIKSTQLIHRLMRHIKTNPEKETYKKDLMKSTQVTAALGLLRKTLPDLVNVEGTIDSTVSGEINHTHEVKDELSDSFNDWFSESNAESSEDKKIQH